MILSSNSFLLLEKHLSPGLIRFQKESKWLTVGSFYSLAGGDLSRKVPGHDYGTTESSIVKFANMHRICPGAL